MKINANYEDYIRAERAYDRQADLIIRARVAIWESYGDEVRRALLHKWCMAAEAKLHALRLAVEAFE